MFPRRVEDVLLFESLSDEQLAELCRVGHIGLFDPGPVYIGSSILNGQL